MTVDISRRKLIALGGVAAVAPGFLIGDARAKADPATLFISDREVTTIPGTDSGFATAVASLYPGLQNDPVFQKLSALAILVTQQSGPGIRALSTSWGITTATGTFETVLYSYVAPGSKKKGRSESTIRSAQRDVLRPGESRLITPFFNWTPGYYQSNPAPNWSALIGSKEPGDFLVSELPNATVVKVSLDAVVFSDWKLIGHDKHSLRKRLRCTRNAEHDEALVVHKLLKSGASDNIIVETLQEHATAQRSSKIHRYARSYDQARRFHAQVLLSCFANTDRATFAQAVRRLKHQPKTVIKKAIA